MTSLKKRSRGITAVGMFLFFGATMACLAGITLAWPGTLLDRVWRLNAPAHARLAPLGKTAGVLFLMLAAALALAGIGWFQRRLWGWRFAVAVIATQMLGDLANVFNGEILRGSIGFIIAGAFSSIFCGRKSGTILRAAMTQVCGRSDRNRKIRVSLN